MSRLKDEYTQQISEEEYDSLGEGARRDLLDYGSHGTEEEVTTVSGVEETS